MIQPLKVYWSSSPKYGHKNFGDWLSPLLVSTLSGREVIHAKPQECDLVAIGSVLQRIKNHWWNRQLHIWGSGFISAQEPVKSRHEYHAVRGKETARLLPEANIKALGDPGLLVDRLLPHYATVPKKYSVGLIPHYKDLANPAVHDFLHRIPRSTIINILSDTQDFLHDVAACDFVVSSSLHGLVVADAFRIPNAWIELSDAVRGARFKFHDYYSVFDINAPEVYRLQNINAQTLEAITGSYRRDNLQGIQKELLAAFPYSRSRDHITHPSPLQLVAVQHAPHAP